jgi:small subunit ribosomal protein S1
MAPCTPPAEVVTAGQEITATLKFDTEKQPRLLGLKQMGDDPMGVCRYPQSTRMFGKITNIADYGAFVELEPGIEGLRTCPDGLDEQERGPFKLVRWATKLKSWSWTSTNSAASRGHEAMPCQPLNEFAGKGTKRGDRVRARSSHRLRRVCWLMLRHRRSGAPVRPVVERAGEVALCATTRSKEAAGITLYDRRRARAHLPVSSSWIPIRFTTFVSINDKGSIVTARSRPWIYAEIDLGEDMLVTCAPAKSARTAWKMRAMC